MAKQARKISEWLPEPDQILAMSDSEIGLVLIEFCAAIPEPDRRRRVLVRDYIGGGHPVEEYPPRYQDQITQALLEGWQWLERNGYIVPEASENNYTISRSGQKLVNEAAAKRAATTSDSLPPEAARNAILRTILELQGNSPSYIDDSRIAAQLNLDLEEVRGHLEILKEADRIQLSRTSSGHSGYLSSGQKQRVREEDMAETDVHAKTTADPTKVFVVHGRNHAARDALFAFLRSIRLHPLEWSEIVRETGEGSPYVGQVLETGFSIVQAVVVLMTPDDEVRLREPYRTPRDDAYESQLTPQPRPNVLIEAGMALGRFPKRTVIVEIGKLRPISDLFGRHAVRLTNSSANRQDLADRLETAGCAVNLRGRDWHTAGDFEGCINDSPADDPTLATTVGADIRLIDGNYWLEKSGGERDGPFCTRCWDVDKKQVRLVEFSTNYLPKCPECDTSFPA